MWWVPAKVDMYQTGKRKKMDSTDTMALRVVLGVTEVSAVAEMELLRKNTERLMKAYHFRETTRLWCKRFLRTVNLNGPTEANTHEEENPGGLWWNVYISPADWFADTCPEHYDVDVICCDAHATKRHPVRDHQRQRHAAHTLPMDVTLLGILTDVKLVHP